MAKRKQMFVDDANTFETWNCNICLYCIHDEIKFSQDIATGCIHSFIPVFESVSSFRNYKLEEA